MFRKVLALVVATIAVVAVYFYTETTIQSEVAPTIIVIAKYDIEPHTEITADMVVATEVPLKALPTDHTYATTVEEVVGKWTVEGYGITSRGFVNKSKILPKEQLPDSGLLELKEGEFAFTTEVNLSTSHGNTIRPGTTVDLFLAAEISEKKLSGEFESTEDRDENMTKFLDETVLYFGRVVTGARVIEVKDSKGTKVFTSAQYTEAPEGAAKSSAKVGTAKLYTVAINLEELDLASKADLIGQVIPVVSGTSYNKLASVEDTLNQEMPESVSDVNETTELIDRLTLNVERDLIKR